jgi:hypothetical protein
MRACPVRREERQIGGKRYTRGHLGRRRFFTRRARDRFRVREGFEALQRGDAAVDPFLDALPG